MAAKTRVGVVGVGYLGRIHARIYAEKIADAELVAVVDSNPEQAKSVAAECHCEALTDHHDLLDRVDAVSIVVPTSLHLEIARPFLEQGTHMLLEKPIAHTLDAGAEIVRLAERSGSFLQIGHLERYNAGVMALAERVKAPRFIEAHRMGEFVARATDVDVVTDLMIHDIDIIMSLVQSDIVSISANGVPVITDHVDIANARLEFANGAVANVTASRVSDKRLRRIRIFEERSYEALDFIDQQVESVKIVPPPAGEDWPEVVREKLQIEPQPPLDAELTDFIAKIRTGGTPLVSGHEGLEALKVAIMVKEKIG